MGSLTRIAAIAPVLIVVILLAYARIVASASSAGSFYVLRYGFLSNSSVEIYVRGAVSKARLSSLEMVISLRKLRRNLVNVSFSVLRYGRVLSSSTMYVNPESLSSSGGSMFIYLIDVEKVLRYGVVYGPLVRTRGRVEVKNSSVLKVLLHSLREAERFIGCRGLEGLRVLNASLEVSYILPLFEVPKNLSQYYRVFMKYSHLLPRSLRAPSSVIPIVIASPYSCGRRIEALVHELNEEYSRGSRFIVWRWYSYDGHEFCYVVAIIRKRSACFGALAFVPQPAQTVLYYSRSTGVLVLGINVPWILVSPIKAFRIVTVTSVSIVLKSINGSIQGSTAFPIEAVHGPLISRSAFIAIAAAAACCIAVVIYIIFRRERT